MKFTTRTAILALSVAETALAHSGITNIFVNGKNQGDAVCLRMDHDPSRWNSPVIDLSGPDMACGRDGTIGVNRVCPVPDGATITFEWRQSANKPGEGVIDPRHVGPCTVYAKKVDSAINDKATGDGWFKLWHEGYDETAGKWCNEKLIATGGLMSVNLPKGLLGGYYLLRAELLALQQATQGQPQYYTGCAQVFLESSGNLGPVSTVAIPGIVTTTDKSDSFNVYETPMKLPYPIPGPDLAKFQTSAAKAQTKQTEGLKPEGCIDESGSNFCGTEIPSYTTQADCWKSDQACWAQADQCWKSTPATGYEACTAWQTKCQGVQSDCQASRAGPANPNKDITPVKKDITPPPPLGSKSAAGGSVSTPSESKAASAAASGKASAVPSVVAKAPIEYPSSAAAPKASAAASKISSAAAAPSLASGDIESTVLVTRYLTTTISGSATPSQSAEGESCSGGYDEEPPKQPGSGAKAPEVSALPKASVAVPSSAYPKPSAVVIPSAPAAAVSAKPSLVADAIGQDGETCDAEGGDDDEEEAPPKPGSKAPETPSAPKPSSAAGAAPSSAAASGAPKSSAAAVPSSAPAAAASAAPSSAASSKVPSAASASASSAAAPYASAAPEQGDVVEEPEKKHHHHGGHQRNQKPGFDLSHFFEYRKNHYGWWKN